MSSDRDVPGLNIHIISFVFSDCVTMSLNIPQKNVSILHIHLHCRFLNIGKLRQHRENLTHDQRVSSHMECLFKTGFTAIGDFNMVSAPIVWCILE